MDKYQKNKVIMMCAMLLGLVVLAEFEVGLAAGAAADLATRCSNVLGKVGTCLPFAQGKADAPTKACCDTASAIKESDPACLCYLIQQFHKGNAALKSMEIQETRLLQIPSACKLTNANIADCPRLLQLAPNDPDNAIFTNATTHPGAPITSPTTTTPAAPVTANSSQGSPHQLLALVALTLVLAFLGAFPGTTAGVLFPLHS